MIGNDKTKNLWALVLAIGICVGWLVSDSIGLEIPSTVTAIMLGASAFLMMAYIGSNYIKKN